MTRFSDPAPLSTEHVVDGFDSGWTALSVWLIRHARQASATGSARTYVTVDRKENRVVGYHAMTVAGIERAQATARVVKGMPRYPIPVVLLARLAVGRTVAGRGIGRWLLRDAMLRAVAASDAVGVRTLLVHAVDEEARGFYVRHGFEPSPTDRLHLMMLVKDIVASARVPRDLRRSSDPRRSPAGRTSTLRGMLTLPKGVERDHPLARFTTIRTGGSAELFARVGTLADLKALLAWAAAHDIEVGVVGSGSNLLVADAGVRGLVVKLDKELAKIEVDGTCIECGGGARLPAVSARAAQVGLSGIEFGVNIPGTVGGAVRMNANAYGGELGSALTWVDVVTAEGTTRRRPEDLAFTYRRSNLTAGEVVARARFALTRAPVDEIKATLAEMRAWRKAAQPSGIKTFGSTFKNPADPQAEGRTAGQLLDAAGCRSLRIGGAGFSEKHANFVENFGEASTADVISVMAEGRRRVKERFGVDLEPEVQELGPVGIPAEWRGR